MLRYEFPENIRYLSVSNLETEEKLAGGGSRRNFFENFLYFWKNASSRETLTAKGYFILYLFFFVNFWFSERSGSNLSAKIWLLRL